MQQHFSLGLPHRFCTLKLYLKVVHNTLTVDGMACG